MSDTELDNRNSPSYLSHYGMFRAPFKNILEDDMYYAEPTRTQRLDILLHLAQYGNELLLVTGPVDSGKTTMLNQFLKRANESWQVCHLDAHLITDKTLFLQRTNSCFNFTEEKLPLDAALGNLKRRLEAMLSTQQTIVIVVDNAHEASTEILNLLLDLATIRNPVKGLALRVMLFSEPQIKIQLASPELQDRQNLPVRKIDLPPFTEQQASRLIRHRVTTAGLVSKNVFNEAIIAKIHKFSEGWPGAITEIAHQVLFESTPIKKRDTRDKDLNGISHKSGGIQALTVLSGIIVIAALLGLILFQDDVNRLYQTATSSQNFGDSPPPQTQRSLTLPGQTPDHNADTLADGTPDLSDTDEQSASLDQDIRDVSDGDDFPELPDEIPDTPPAEKRSIVADKVPTAPLVYTVKIPAETGNERSPVSSTGSATNATATTTDTRTTTPLPAEKPASTTAGDATIKINPVIADADKSAEPADPSSPVTDNITLPRQEEWVLAQDPTHYTLQLVAGYQATTINKFIRKQLLPETEFAYYHSLNKGKNWHSLLHGVYSSRNKAAGAASELSRQIKSIRPWIRPLKSIQRDIRYARNRTQNPEQ